ncbi:hypothetical protein CR162_11260 [Pseudoroseomonas rhizosphaerae]|uniref:DUF2946 domain-containing protein n=1 Tax=Teichococcus rhizosphaerae TaxID=1335062 RepID=A0A2C7ADY8_9PROT|nr:hypothetical protein [Pseudoroseomonas rhizosphaerae]PHK94857.1 hypothetical protein CR162_11260 [Pseudoroseomonas rhizosphaerae]
MPRRARFLLRLLAALLLVQWGGGLLPHLRAMAAVPGEAVVICTPEGYHTIRLGPDGTPGDAPEKPKGGCCLLCQAPATSAGLPPPDRLPEPRLVAAPAMAMAAAMRALAFRPPPRVLHSRAPPIS